MSNKTKLVVLKSKELIYTGIFLLLGIVLIFVLYYMFSKSDEEKSGPDAVETSATTYKSGIYTSDVNLGGSNLQVAVTVDKNTVTNVALNNLDESVTAMYPLLEPTLTDINAQITVVDSIDDISYSSENQYTSIIIMEAIKDALTDSIITY